MTKLRSTLTIAAIAAVALSIAAAPAPAPVVTMTGRLAPKDGHVPRGTPLTFTLDTRFGSRPPGADLVLQRLVYLFPRDAVVNGRLFPSCSAAALARANGRLSVCPRGSKVGFGSATGTAVALGVTSHAVIALFNGPGGRSITMNVSITTPAVIDATFAAPLATLHGGPWGNRLTVDVPTSLQSVLDGDIVTSRIDVTTGATRTIHGVRRGYIEPRRCQASGRVRVHADFTFSRGASASANATVVC